MGDRERDAERSWGLAEQPGRLRISTIDAVNSWLAGRAPLAAGSHALNRISDNNESLFREAVRRVLGLANDEDRIGAALGRILKHFDNRADRVIEVMTLMLARRDQWLRHIGAGQWGDEERAGLEDVLHRFVSDALELPF